MGLIKASKTQRGADYIFECSCGSHLLRLINEEHFGIGIEFWEYRGDTNYSLWERIKLGLRILFGREAKSPIYDVLITNEDAKTLAENLLKMSEEEPKQKFVKYDLKAVRKLIEKEKAVAE